MKRRSFFGALAAVVLSPMAMAKEKPLTADTYCGAPIKFIPPLQRLYIKWFLINMGPKWSPALFYPTAHIRFRLNDFEWEESYRCLPCQIAPGFWLKMKDGRPEFVMDDTDGVPREICFFDPDAFQRQLTADTYDKFGVLFGDGHGRPIRVYT
jgi:hypothetical protein